MILSSAYKDIDQFIETNMFFFPSINQENLKNNIINYFDEYITNKIFATRSIETKTIDL
jgi:hypothetical protein